MSAQLQPPSIAPLELPLEDPLLTVVVEVELLREPPVLPLELVPALLVELVDELVAEVPLELPIELLVEPGVEVLLAEEVELLLAPEVDAPVVASPQANSFVPSTGRQLSDAGQAGPPSGEQLLPRYVESGSGLTGQPARANPATARDAASCLRTPPPPRSRPVRPRPPPEEPSSSPPSHTG